MSMLFGKQNLLQSILVDLNSPLQTMFGSFGWVKKQINGSIFLHNQGLALSDDVGKQQKYT